MIDDDKTVDDNGATVPENMTVYDSGATVPDNDATVFDSGVATLPEGAGADSAAGAFVKIEKDVMLLDTYRVASNAIESGGMGRVWRVHHTGWNVDLAMKQPRAKFFATEKNKKDFVRECEVWINLGLHPNIVSCYYVREINGIPSIFSEWMDGGSLADAIEDGGLYAGSEAEQQERILDIALQFARGLHYAHERRDENGQPKGLIHQDVKPGNLLLTKDGEAKVADFGLVKARAALTMAEGSSGELTAYDGSGKTMFSASGGYTPAYCSIEQKNGKQLTRRTDIYSWAVSVMEMYLGERPWANGVIAGAACESYFSGARVAIPEKMRVLLKCCMNEEQTLRPHDFAAIDKELLAIFREETGQDYPRSVSKAASDTADSLNNKALSFLDLGFPRQAEVFWEKALAVEPGHLDSIYNQGLYMWRKGKIDDFSLLAKLESSPNSSGWKYHYLCALVHMERDDICSAVSSLKAARELSEDNEGIGKLLLALEQREPKDLPVRLSHEVNLGKPGNFISMSYDDKELVAYSAADRCFWSFDAQTGSCLGMIREEDFDTGCGLQFGIDKNTFWSSGPDGLVRYSLEKKSPTDYFAGREDAAIRSFAFDAHEKKVISLLHSEKEVKFYEIPYVQMWDCEKDEPVFEMKCRLCGRIFLSPDAGRFAAVSADTDFPAVEVWCTGTKSRLLELKGHTQKINSLDVNRSFTLALTSSRDGTFRLWDINTGKCLKTYQNLDSTGNEDIRILPDEHRALILNSGNSHFMRLLDLTTGRVLRSFGSKDIASRLQESVCIGSSGKLFAAVKQEEGIEIWEISHCNYPSEWSLSTIEATVQRVLQERRFQEALCRAKVCFAGRRMDEALTALDRARSISGFKYDAACLALLDELSRYCRVKSLKDCRKAKVLEGHWDGVRFGAVSPDGSLAVSACGGNTDDQIMLWDAKTGKWLRPILHSTCCRTGTFSPDGRYFLAEDNKSILCSELFSREIERPDGSTISAVYARIQERYPCGRYVSFLKYHPGGKHFAAAECDFAHMIIAISVWNVQGREPLYKVEGDFEAMDLSPDGAWIAVAERNERVSLIAFDTGKPVLYFPCTDAGIPCFSPDGRYLAVGGKNSGVRIYDVRNGNMACVLEGNGSTALCYSQDGRFLFVAGKESGIAVWDVKGARLVRLLQGHFLEVNHLSVSRKNDFLLSASEDKTLIRWDMEWEYEFPGWSDWDEAAGPYLNKFTRLLPRWTEADFEKKLIPELQIRGYGWLKPGGVRERLMEIRSKA